MPLRRTAALALAWLAASTLGPAAVRVPDAAVRAFDGVTPGEVHAYVETLAGDAFGGRGVGDPGNRAAEEYICATLRQASVTPAAADGTCYQSVPVYSPVLGPKSSVRVTRADGGVVADLSVGADFYPLPESGGGDVSGPIVFVNHGIVSGQHDDYAGTTARGAIVLALDGGTGTGAVDEASITTKVANAAARGARGLLIVATTLADYRFIWPPEDSSRPPAYNLASRLRENLPAAMVSERAAQPTRRALSTGTALTATLRPDVVAPAVTMHNVLGIVEGRDPARRDEMVVVGAHLDHDGTDAQGRVYNGADDNASGTAAVLAAAAAFARAAAEGERPARAVLFALWNGEEKGSLGAEAFVASPQPKRRVIANLNLDMVGRHEEIPDPNNWRFAGLPKVDPATSVNTLHVLGYSYSPDLAAELREANGAVGLSLREDYDVGAQDLLHRSDHWPFVAHGIPALFLTTGLHPDYHTPDDDTARIDFGKLARVARLAARAAWIVADGPPPTLKRR